jgi:hypothetical protein
VVLSGSFHAIRSWIISEVSGVATQSVTFYDGATSTGSTSSWGPINLAPGQTVTYHFGDVGLTASSGSLFMGIGQNCRGTPSGLVAGVVFIQ